MRVVARARMWQLCGLCDTDTRSNCPGETVDWTNWRLVVPTCKDPRCQRDPLEDPLNSSLWGLPRWFFFSLAPSSPAVSFFFFFAKKNWPQVVWRQEISAIDGKFCSNKMCSTSSLERRKCRHHASPLLARERQIAGWWKCCSLNRIERLALACKGY
jgi:hypothetical protein